jgi:hypothetical protein
MDGTPMSTDTTNTPEKGSGEKICWRCSTEGHCIPSIGYSTVGEPFGLCSNHFDLAMVAGWKPVLYDAALASVPRLEETTDITPSKEDEKIAWQMQHPNAMGTNWPGIPGNPYPPLADHLCCKRLLEQARAEVEALKADRDRSTPHRNKESGTAHISDERLADMCKETKWWKTDNDEIYRVVHELVEIRAALATAEEAGIRMREKLRQLAIHMSYDCPGDVPVECGLWCDLCKEHVENDRTTGHKPDCILALLSEEGGIR